MQKNKRVRIFAGPNGSGKSTLFNEFKKQYQPGYFINADDIEKQLSSSGLFDLKSIGINATEKDLTLFKKTKEARSLLLKSSHERKEINIEIVNNFVVDKTKVVNSYEASFVAAFIRWLMYREGISFSYETVMSHVSKLDEIKKAKIKNYKIYLYFVCTDGVEINVNRVANRVEKGGHPVDGVKIRSRYISTLKNLFPAIQQTNRSYLFDNSGKKLELIAEIFEGILQLKVNNPPKWFIDFVLPFFKEK